MIQIKIFKGHIRNHVALCEELGIAPNLSREDREHEIIVKAYEKWGTQIADHLLGMFAIVLYDSEADKIFAVRDQFGTKPLYYYITEDNRLLCGTQIRDIMAMDGFKKELNEDMLQLYLTLTYVAGENTFFKGVKKLLPGRYMEWKDGKLEIVRYWKPEFHPDNSKSVEEYADEIHETMKQIFTEVKTDDESVESFLSSGVDSSYVLALSDAKKAASCGYKGSSLDESMEAEKTAQKLGRDFSRVIITPEGYFDTVHFAMQNLEQPLGDASTIVFTMGCKAAAETTKICYSGEGSDEMFGGYNMYRNAERYGDNLPTFYVGNTNIMKEDLKEKLLKNYDPENLPIHLADPIYKDMEGYDPLSKMQAVDIELWLEGDIYFAVDKLSTACGLEIRMPITDMRMFDIASRLPVACKINEEQNKVAFRTAAAKVLPEEVAFRKKLGFVVPIRYWLADSDYNKDVVRLFKSDIAGKFFKEEELQKLYDEFVDGNSDLWRQVWTIYTFLVWYEEYFVRH